MSSKLNYNGFNFSINGYSTDQLYIILDNVIDFYKPKIVIYTFVKNDLEFKIGILGKPQKSNLDLKSLLWIKSYIKENKKVISKNIGDFLSIGDIFYVEKSKNKIETKLPVGSCVIANNYFWLHGRKPFKENKNLSRELLRIRGTFFQPN